MNQMLLDEIIAYSRQNGYRKATKRVAVATALSQLNTYVDANSLWISLRSKHPRISQGTVYAALKWLTESGMADRKIRDDRTYIFSLRSPAS